MIRFVGDENQKKFTKNPHNFQCKIPRQVRERIHKCFLESGQSKKRFRVSGSGSVLERGKALDRLPASEKS